MSMQQAQTQQMKKGDPLAFLLLLMHAHATTVTVFTRRGFGREGLGLPGAGALVTLLVLTPGNPVMVAWLAFFLLFLVARRIETMSLLRQNVQLHSRSPGWPALAMSLPFVRRERTAALFIEPLMVILCGALLCPLNQVAGGFMMSVSVSMLVREVVNREVYRKRLERMADAEIEGKWLSDAHRGRIKDW